MHKRHETLAGWGGYPAAETDVVRPERLAEARAAARAAPRLIARGLGRSYGDAAVAGQGTTVLMERLDRLLAIDEAQNVVECEAGLSLRALLPVLVARGLFPPVVPGTEEVTVGGMLACDVHGKGHHRRGSFSRHVEAFDLVLAGGERRRVTRADDPALFGATAAGLGLTGLVETVRFRVQPIESAWLSVTTERARDYQDALARFHDADAGYAYSVAWIDCLAGGGALGRSVLFRGNWLAAGDLGGARGARALETPRRPAVQVPFHAPAGLLNPLTVRAFNAAYYHAHPGESREVPTPYPSFFFPLDVLHDWNRLYGRSGLLQYQCVVPERGGEAALQRLLEELVAAGAASFLAVLKRFGPGEDGVPLSFPRPGYTLALDLAGHHPDTLALLDRLDAVVLDAGGRVYLAKDARLSPASFRRMYPEYEGWREVKRQVDPENRFCSDLARRLMIEP